jgi:NADH:ubiquinone oxidoreductase subunit 4 (subunit M)
MPVKFRYKITVPKHLGAAYDLAIDGVLLDLVVRNALLAGFAPCDIQIEVQAVSTTNVQAPK